VLQRVIVAERWRGSLDALVPKVDAIAMGIRA